MADEVARLVAVMEAQLRGFTKGMEQAQRIADQKFGQIERRMNRTEKIFGTGFATIGRSLTRFLSVAAITAFTRSLLNTADRLSDTAAQIDITTQQLQELQYAARATGGSADAIAGALGFLNDRLGDAAKGEGELAEIMRELNIPMGDAVTVLHALADATKNAGTQAERARIATAAFGKAGKDNISFLQQGSDGLRTLADEAHRLNQVWSPETVARLDKLRESFSSLSAAFTNLAAGPMATVLSNMSAFINDLSRGDWADRAEVLMALLSGGYRTGGTRPDISADEQFNRRLGSIQKELFDTETSQLYASGSQRAKDRVTALRAEMAEMFAGLDSPMSKGMPARPDGAPPPPKPGGADPEKTLLAYLGLPDLPSGDKFMELYWQTMADRAEAAYGRQVAERRGEPRALTAPEIAPVNVLESLLTDAPFVELSEIERTYTDALISGAEEAAVAWGDSYDLMASAAFNAFTTMEDTFVQFARTGKLEFSQLVDSIIADLARIAVRQAITDPLTRGFAAALDSLGGGGGNWGQTGTPLFQASAGGIARRPSIFGEAGPEAAVPLPDGRRIPVELRMPASPNAAGRAVHLTTQLHWTLEVRGNGDKELIANMRAGMGEIMRQYDRELPARVNRLANDPHLR